jgi:hypothetical protein
VLWPSLGAPVRYAYAIMRCSVSLTVPWECPDGKCGCCSLAVPERGLDRHNVQRTSTGVIPDVA